MHNHEPVYKTKKPLLRLNFKNSKLIDTSENHNFMYKIPKIIQTTSKIKNTKHAQRAKYGVNKHEKHKSKLWINVIIK